MKTLFKKEYLSAFFALISFAYFLYVTIYFDSLISSQQYIFNYYLLMNSIFLCLGISFIQMILYFMQTKNFVTFFFINLNSVYLAAWICIFEPLANYLNFRFSFSSEIYLFAISVIIYFVFLFKIKNLKIKFSLLVPIIIFAFSAYLEKNNYFQERAGTYPSYQNNLLFYKHKIDKSLENFLSDN